MRLLVTGGSGFIGSHLVDEGLRRAFEVLVIDDLATGRPNNLGHCLEHIRFVRDTILNVEALQEAMAGVDVCLHQAAIPSVQRSVEDPFTTTQVNVEGTLNVLEAARLAGVRRVVLASSSSVYGDAAEFPLHEDLPLRPLSPYAASKATTELYAHAYTKLHGLEVVCLRYFNVFGPRQNPKAAYAAVVPAFIQRLRMGEAPVIYGTGEQVRDFTYIENVVHANYLAATHPWPLAGVFNVAAGEPISLIELAGALAEIMGVDIQPRFEAARRGDLPRSFASIERAGAAFGYAPVVHWREGLERTVAYFMQGKED